MNPVIPIQMSQEQADAISQAAEELKMSRQDVVRQTLKLYLREFRERMSPRPKFPRRLSGWDALRGGRGIELDIRPMTGKVKKIDL